MDQIFTKPVKLFFEAVSIFLILFVSTSHAHAENEPKEVYEVLDQYMDAVNRIDIESIVSTYHFPHFRVARGEIVVWNTPKEAMPMLGLPRDQQLAAMRIGLGPDWQRTEWGHRTVISYSAKKAHVDTEFIRYSVSGKEMERVNSLYILTKEKGIWRIKGRSSFASR